MAVAEVRTLLGKLSEGTLAAIEADLEESAEGRAGKPAPSEDFLHLADGRRIPGKYEVIVEHYGTREEAKQDQWGIGSFGHTRRKVPIWNNQCDLGRLHEEHRHAKTCGSMTFVDETDKEYYLGRCEGMARGGIAPGTFTDILPI